VQVNVSLPSDLSSVQAGFEPFEITGPSYDDLHWIDLRAGDRSGVLGSTPASSRRAIHATPTTCSDRPTWCVDIGFETSEPLDVLVERLRSAGLDPTMITDGPDPRVVLVDPDGEEVQIHPTS